MRKTKRKETQRKFTEALAAVDWGLGTMGDFYFLLYTLLLPSLQMNPCDF